MWTSPKTSKFCGRHMYMAPLPNSLSFPEWVYELPGPVIREIREREYESAESAFRGRIWPPPILGFGIVRVIPARGSFRISRDGSESFSRKMSDILNPSICYKAQAKKKRDGTVPRYPRYAAWAPD